MRRAEVDRVFLGASFSTDQTFTQQAEAQGWRPQFSVSDLWANNVDPLAKNFPPDQFDGVFGSAANHSGEKAVNVAYSPGVQKCNEMITKAGLPPITAQMGKDPTSSRSATTSCFGLAVMKMLPVKFSRAQWATAVPQVGAMKMPAVAASATLDLASSKAETPTQWWMAQGLQCWVRVRPHQPGKF